MEINIKNAYDEQTQKDLFYLVAKENLSDEDEYSAKQIEQAKQNDGIFRSLDDLADHLYKEYVNKYAPLTSHLDPDLTYYAIIDYSAMLYDDLATGYFDLIKCNNNDYCINMWPEGRVESHLTRDLAITDY